MWTWTHERLVAQQVSARQGTLAGQSQRYPWVLPRVSTARWHVNETVAETLAFCASVPEVELYACPVTTHVAVPWFHTTQLQRATNAGVTAPIAEGPQPFCKYWWTGQSYVEHFDVGSADVYHGFGDTRAGIQTTHDLFRPIANRKSRAVNLVPSSWYTCM